MFGHLGHTDRRIEGLTELRTKALQALVDERTDTVQMQGDLSKERIEVEVQENEQLPDTYGTEKRAKGDAHPHTMIRGKMAEALDTPVTMHLKGVDLSTFIAAISEDKNINMIGFIADDVNTGTDGIFITLITLDTFRADLIGYFPGIFFPAVIGKVYTCSLCRKLRDNSFTNAS